MDLKSEDDSEGLTRPPSQPREAGDRKLKGAKCATFWYSTGDSRSMNTKDDLDMELTSLDKFLDCVRRIVFLLHTCFRDRPACVKYFRCWAFMHPMLSA